jgi:hypothetical protein
MTVKTILGIFFGIAIIILSQYFYHPDLSLMLINSAILVGLWGLVLWSGTRVGKGASALFKLALVALVASFMFSQAVDVVYSVSSAPAGARLETAPEVIIYAAGLWGLTMLVRLFALGPQKEK